MKIVILFIVFVVNVTLAALKYFLGIQNNSVSIICDSYNNILDALIAAILLMIAIYFTLVKSDKAHKNKISNIASLMVYSAMALLSFDLLKKGVDRIIVPEPIIYDNLFLALLICNIIVKVMLAVFLWAMNKREKSGIYKTIAIDSACDSFIGICLLVSYFLSVKGINMVDGILAICLFVFILISAIIGVVQTARNITEKHLTYRYAAEITTIAMGSMEGVCLANFVFNSTDGGIICTCDMLIDEDTAIDLKDIEELKEQIYGRHKIVFKPCISVSSQPFISGVKSILQVLQDLSPIVEMAETSGAKQDIVISVIKVSGNTAVSQLQNLSVDIENICLTINQRRGVKL